MRRFCGILTLVASSIIGLTGCSGLNVRTLGFAPSENADRKAGIVYRLPIVAYPLTISRSKACVADLKIDTSKPQYYPDENEGDLYLSYNNVPLLSNNTMSIQVDDNGLLMSVNGTSENKTAAIITEAFKLAKDVSTLASAGGNLSNCREFTSSVPFFIGGTDREVQIKRINDALIHENTVAGEKFKGEFDDKKLEVDEENKNIDKENEKLVKEGKPKKDHVKYPKFQDELLKLELKTPQENPSAAWNNNPWTKVAKCGEASLGTKKNVEGICARLKAPFVLEFELHMSGRIAQGEILHVMAPSPSLTYLIPYRDKIFTKLDVKLTFVNGVLTKIDSTDSSEAFAAIGIPAEIVKGVIGFQTPAKKP